MNCSMCGAPNRSNDNVCAVCAWPLSPGPAETPRKREVRGGVHLGAIAGEALAVRSVEADVIVDGPFALSELIVVFENDLGRVVEGDLVFPLPASAALAKLVVTVGDRVLTGKVRTRDRAAAEYTRAAEAGKTAALGETEGEDLARLRVAPIEGGERVEVALGVVQTMLPTDGGHRLIVPLTYMPRFVEDPAALKEIEAAAVDRPRPLTLAARANVRVSIAHGASGAPKLKCVSHPTLTTERAGGGTLVKVGPVPLDRDLVLEMMDRPSGERPALWHRYDATPGPDGLGPTTAIAIVPPAYADEGPVIPRAIHFLVDRSGSMASGPMSSAIRAVRGCLRALTPADRFNIVAFDDALEAFADRPVPFDDAMLAAADAFIGRVTARGGTHASLAIGAVLDGRLGNAEVSMQAPQKGDDAPHRLRVLIFMTDGDVGDAEAVLATARAKLVDTRVHVIGIGYAVNHAMLASLATAGGGVYIPVATDEDLERAISRLKNAIYAPLWTTIKVAVDHDGDRRAPKQLEPAGPLDLFGGQPALFAFRGPVEPGDRIVVTGQRADGEDLSLAVEVGAAASNEQGRDLAPLVWALLKNKRLTYKFDPADDPTLEALGTAFGIANRAVALVATDGDERGVTVTGTVPVVLPVPANVASMTLAGGPPMAGGYGGPPPGFGPAMSPALMGPPPMVAYAMAPPGMGGPPPAPPPPPPPVVMRAPLPAMPSAAAAPVARAARGYGGGAPRPAPRSLTNDEAGLRALLLMQSADGLFEGDLAVTLAAAAALVSRGHTHREGLFKAELKRTLASLRRLAGTSAGDDAARIALAIALLTRPHDEELPAGLPAGVTAVLSGFDAAEASVAEPIVRAALAAAPLYRGQPLSEQIVETFELA